MTYEEAIKELKQIPSHIGGDCDGYELRAISLAIEALEKQIPKKPERRIYLELDDDTVSYECPICGEILCEEYSTRKYDFRYDFCPACGESIDWSDIE